jgi:hypothetical protein
VPKHSEPAWLLKVFATALSKQNTAVLSGLAAAADHNELGGGVLVERAYEISDVTTIMADHDKSNVVIVPPSEVVMMPSADVPTGRVHHVMHFMDGDTCVFTRLYTEPASEVRGRQGV